MKLLPILLSLILVSCGKKDKPKYQSGEPKQEETDVPAEDSQPKIPELPPAEPPFSIPDNEDGTTGEEGEEGEELPDSGDLDPESELMQQAFDAACSGPAVDRLKIMGHHWNIKPLIVTENGNETTVRGTFEHSVRFSPADQINLSLTIVDGKITSEDFEILEKGFSSIAAPIANVVSRYFNLPLTEEMIESGFEELEKLLTGDWQTTSQVLGLKMAMECYNRSK